MSLKEVFVERGKYIRPAGRFFLIFMLLVPKLAIAQTAAQQDLVNVEPERCFTGGTIEVFGWVKPNHPGNTFVNLDFFKPVSGKKISEKVRTNAKGNYSFLFKQTDEQGLWKVTAWKQGTRLKKDASFEVSRTVFLSPLCREVKQESEETRAAFEYFKGQVVNYPDFPGKDSIIKSVADLFRALHEMAAVVSLLDNAVQQMNRVLSQVTNLPIPARDELVKAAQKADDTIKETGKQTREIREVLEQSKQETEWCYIWMAYNDLCEQLKFYNNFLADSLKGIAQNLIQAKLTQGLDQKLQDLIGKVVDAATGSPKSPVDVANKIMGKMADLGSKVYSDLLKNCTTFSGDSQGEYYTELLHNEMVFYTMSYKLSGKLELTFEKRKPGDPAVYLKGRFKGKAHDFSCFITMAPFARPDTIGPVYCLSATPLVSNRSFLLYLEGKAVDDLMELKLTKPGRDFKLKSRAFYIMLSSAAYNLPIPGEFSFPLQNAEWFLTRATKISNPSIEYFKLPIRVQGDISKAEKEFERTIYLPETKKRVGVRVQLKLKLKACSPKCK